MSTGKVRFPVFLISLAILLLASGGPALAQPISPAMEQEFRDAKNAVDAAQKSQAEKYAPEPLKQAQDLLVTAENARSFKDSVKFTQTSRLARAYAELARAMAELKTEEEKLAATQDELQKARAELERLKKAQ
jgi:ubiquinone biosynthesis protein UbiJ